MSLEKFGTPKSARVSLMKIGFDFHLVRKQRFRSGSALGAAAPKERKRQRSGSAKGAGAAYLEEK